MSSKTVSLKNETKSGHAMPQEFDTEQTLNAVEALLAHTAKAKANSIFDSPTRILLDITTFKIVDGQNHIYNIVLPNSPYPETADVLMIIPDEYDESPDRKQIDSDLIANQMKDKLKHAGVIIREVLTVAQLRNEYSTFEAKRKLAQRIDLVLAHKTVFKKMPSLLGREFYRKKKFVLGIDCDTPDLAKVVETALRKTVLNISLKGNTTSVPVGHDNLSAPELSENVYKITNWLMRQFPGGWENISKLSVYTGNIPPLIIYLSKGSRNDVKKAITKGSRSRSPVEGGLSTLPGRRVRVHPRGEIEVLQGNESDESDNEVDIKDEDVKSEDDAESDSE